MAYRILEKNDLTVLENGCAVFVWERTTLCGQDKRYMPSAPAEAPTCRACRDALLVHVIDAVNDAFDLGVRSVADQLPR